MMADRIHELLPFQPGQLVIVDDEKDPNYNKVLRVDTIDLKTGQVLGYFRTDCELDGTPVTYHADQLVPRA